MAELGPSVQDLFDMTGMVALVTGRCQGLGPGGQRYNVR